MVFIAIAIANKASEKFCKDAGRNLIDRLDYPLTEGITEGGLLILD